MEIWESLPRYTSRYEISSYGRIRNIKTGRIIRATRNGVSQNSQVTLTKELRDEEGEVVTVTKTERLGNLVASAFLPAPEEPYTSLLYRDGDRMNCNVDNLVWMPRWFVVHYMKQINQEAYSQIGRPFIAEQTGERFQTIREFSIQALALPFDVHRSLNGDSIAFKGYGLLSYL